MYTTRLERKDLPSLYQQTKLLFATVLGSLLTAAAAPAQAGWQTISPADSIWALARQQSTLPWVWAERIQPGALPGHLSLEESIPRTGWLIPYQSVLSPQVAVPYRAGPNNLSQPAYRWFQIPVRSPRRLPENLPLLPERPYRYQNPNLFVWSGDLTPLLGDVMLLAPEAHIAGPGDSIWATGLNNVTDARVYFLPPEFSRSAGAMGKAGFAMSDSTGLTQGRQQALTQVRLISVANPVSVGHRVAPSRVDEAWRPHEPVRFPRNRVPITGVIPLEGGLTHDATQVVPNGKEVGLPVGAEQQVQPGQAWRVIQAGSSRFDPLRQTLVRYPDQTVAHILTLRVYDSASIAFILSGSIPDGVALILEPV